MALRDLVLRPVRNRHEDPENPRPSFETRLTPLHGLRVVSPEQAGGTFEIDKEAVFQYMRYKIRDVIEEDDLKELKSKGVDYLEMAVHSPSWTLEILPKETFDRLSTVLGELSLLEKTEIYH